MKNLYEKVIAMSDEDFASIEAEEQDFLKCRNAVKLHEFDNIAIDKDGNMIALENITAGDDIIKNGNVFAKCSRDADRGEHVYIR